MSKKADPLSYKQFPAIARYIDRIGAEQKNARRFLIVEHKARGYYAEKCAIKLNAEGDVSCTDKFYAPTKEEAEAIKAEIIANQGTWPTSILATEAKLADLRKATGRNANLFVFYSRDVKPRDGNIIMVQQRVEKENREKYFINWTLFSDGEWRMMEPDQALPFWKPPVEEGYEPGGKLIMVHEGAKTARYLTELKKTPGELAKHPWAQIISRYEHWGMIGGALVPHRTDWQELVREKPDEVIYVCDNDHPGKRALQLVSSNYKRPLLGVMFDKRFEVAWDMGDAMPPQFFTNDGRWIGPPFEEFLTFATYATNLVANPEGKGRPTAQLTDYFRQEWYHCVTPEVFVHHRWPALILTAQEFNNHVAPFSHVDNTDRLLKKDKASKSAILSYQPGRPSGIYADTNGTYINTHIPTSVPDLKEEEKFDAKPWLDFIEHLVPEASDRLELLRWCATLIARPDIKMLYGVLLISEAQGIGKGTLGERILAPLVGATNVSYPSEGEIVDSNYNYWAAHKRLAVVHEIYAGHSAKAYNKLKSIVTDRYITVQKKYQANYEIENWIHIFACSNSMRAIQLSMDDRRWFVPKLTEEIKPTKYWDDFNRWLIEGGLTAIKAWAGEWILANGPVIKGASAPWSIAKKEIVEEGWSPGMNVAAAGLDFLRHQLTSDEPGPRGFRDRLASQNMFKDGSAFVTDVDLVKYISSKLYDGRHSDRIEKPATVRKVAKAKGWHIGDERVMHYRWGQDRYKSRVVSLLPKEAKAKPSEIEGLKPIDLSVIEGM